MELFDLIIIFIIIIILIFLLFSGVCLYIKLKWSRKGKLNFNSLRKERDFDPSAHNGLLYFYISVSSMIYSSFLVKAFFPLICY